jgi:heat shock protein HslJ
MSAFSQQETIGKWKLGSFSLASKKAYNISEFGTFIEFADELRFGGSTGCNSYRGQFVQKGGEISAGNIISTDMMCPGEKAEFEMEFLDLLGKVNKLEVKGNALTLTDTKTGYFLRFVKDKPETVSDTENDNDTETLYVANRTVRCRGIEPLRCMLVKRDRNAKWENYYDTIIGFDHKPGQFYKLKVRRTPAPEGNELCVYRHQLVKVLAKGKTEAAIYRN